MEKWIFLSYPISENTPAYGGINGFSKLVDKSIAAGDSCNTQIWNFQNHIGTHVDLPRHFSEKGFTMDAYSADQWIFKHPCVLDISPVAPESLIMPEQIDLTSIPKETDILLILTGFFIYRGEHGYWRNSPGISPVLADVIRKHLPAVRVLGFDMISISSLAHREVGRKAHRAFLDHEQPILLIEDMDLSGLNGRGILKQVVVAPLYVQGADGAPCSVFAKFNEIIDMK